MGSAYSCACSMRTYLFRAAFGLWGRFRKNNKLFHEQQMTPGPLRTSLSPRSPAPKPSTLVPAPFRAPLPPLPGTSQRMQGLAAARCLWPRGQQAHVDWPGATAARTLPPPQRRSWPGSVCPTQQWNFTAWNKKLKISRDNYISAKFRENWLTFASRFQVVQERWKRVGHTESTITRDSRPAHPPLLN